LSDGADQTWFEQELSAALPELFGTARRMTRNDMDAEDLVADTVAKACARLEQLQDRTRFRGWMCRILTNNFISQRRAAAVRPSEEPLPPEGAAEAEFSLFERLHQPFLLWWGNPEQRFLDELLREDLERAIASLPDAFRVVVVLADVQGFKYAEIADSLEIPVGTVRSRLARGRSLLQKALYDHACDAGLVSRATETRKPNESE
jgi:RNA polymerase sigma-70 factor (ECF subfamily)